MQHGTTENLNFNVLTSKFSASLLSSVPGLERWPETKFLVSEMRDWTSLPTFLPALTFCDS